MIEIRFCRGSNPACSKSIFTIAEIFDCGFGLQIKLVPFCKLALNDQYSTSCRNHSITPSKQTCGSNVRPNKTFSAFNVLASKPVCDSNVCSRKSVSVSDVNVHPTKSVKASNICSGKPVCRNNIRSSKPICRSNVCQSKPTNVNILPCKPVLTDHTYHVDSSILSQQLFFIFFLSILIFSVYYKFSIITMNIFTNLLLAIVILLSKLTCLREFFIMFISGSSTFLRFSLNTYITFQSCRTMLLLKTEVSFLPIIYVFLLY